MTRWAAPTATAQLSGRVVVPGSKSSTARAYVLAALADAPSRLTGVLDARDTALMRGALTVLGVTFSDEPDGTVLVTPPSSFSPGVIDVGQAGTAEHQCSLHDLDARGPQCLRGISRFDRGDCRSDPFARRAEFQALPARAVALHRFLGRGKQGLRGDTSGV